MAKLKYILGGAFLAGAIATNYCSLDPLGPALLGITTLGGLACVLAAAVNRAWKEIAPLLVLSFLGVVAMPSMIDRCRTESNDTAAVKNLRTISTAEVTYQSQHTTYGSLDQLIAEGLIDPRFKEPVAGYRYDVAIPANGVSYTAKAVRASPRNGLYEYYLEPDGIVRYSTSAAPRDAGGKPVP